MQIVALVAVVVAVLVGLGVYVKRVSSPAGKGAQAVAGTAALSGGSATREVPPADIAVPGVNATDVPSNVAIPNTTVPASAGGGSMFRSFDVQIAGGKFVPDTVIVNQGDTVRLNLTAVDGAYDFAQTDFGLRLALPKGQTKVQEFSATAAGNFLFYCSSCGGPAKGPQGRLVVAPKN